MKTVEQWNAEIEVAVADPGLDRKTWLSALIVGIQADALEEKRARLVAAAISGLCSDKETIDTGAIARIAVGIADTALLEMKR